MKFAHPPAPSEIVSACCATFGVTLHEFIGRQRHPRIVDARRLCVALMRKHTTLSYPDISRAMVRTNHSTTITMHQDFARKAPHAGEWLQWVAEAEAMLAGVVADRRAAS